MLKEQNGWGLFVRKKQHCTENKKGSEHWLATVCTIYLLVHPSSGGSGMVDANMMILRKRIQSLRTQETFYDMPKEWMEWERSAYASYRADICLLLSTIESQLLIMRPSIALSVVSMSLAVLPVASLLFLTALGTQIWTLNCALLDLIPSSH